MDKLLISSAATIQNAPLKFTRYMMTRINWGARMIGLVGPRGVGKTTLLWQYAKLNLPLNQTLYVSADSIYFADHTLQDLAHEMVLRDMHYLLIDEIHKYEQWSRELKYIYDFEPDLKVVFTGSSVLDILEGQADLSRRAVMYQMQGLSFREYLMLFHDISTPQVTIEQIINHDVLLEGVKHPLPYFEDYLNRGYYPFGRDANFFELLNQVVSLTMQVDIPRYAKMPASTGQKLERLMAVISKSVPFKPSMQKLADAINASRNVIGDYLLYMEKAGMLSQLRTEKGGVRSLGKTDKIYLDNTNLGYLLADSSADKGNLRETFFFNQVRVDHDITTAERADFTVDEHLVFEIGGKNKQQHQISNYDNGYIVKDDIEVGYVNVVPLWAFGLLY